MTSVEIRQKFLDFFKARGHTIVPSSSLVPDDPSVLLTTAGMQQFKPYYSELDPMTTVHPSIGKPIGKNAASCQKSFRTSDIDEVGDERHLTFFEMLGNFSFGGYFKKEAIRYAHEFITKEMGLRISYVTVFEGKEDIGVPKDMESRDIWKSLDSKLEVREEGMGDVFWGPTGSSGPCGPTTEIYCKNGAGQDIEVWNIVFNQYFYPGSREELNAGAPDKKLEPLKTPGVDTGMGFERLVMCVQNVPTIFDTDLFRELMEKVKINTLLHEDNIQNRRIIADHVRGIVFLISDGVRPSNRGVGYVLRRLMRRVIAYGANYGDLFRLVARNITYDFYRKELERNWDTIGSVFVEERRGFQKMLDGGIQKLKRIQKIGAEEAFYLYQSFGLPYETIKAVGREKAKDLKREDFDEEFKKHQEISRAGQEKKFGGHGLILDTGEVKAGNQEEFQKALKLHTTTHLLQRALREVLGNEVHQMGSDVTAERTRFDFSFPRKLTKEEIEKVEKLINEKIEEDLSVNFVELPKAEAEKSGALFFFKEKYPEKVKVYFFGKDLKSAWSKEFCGGPHVMHTGEIGKVKIAKEEAVSAGVRRIRAVLAE